MTRSFSGSGQLLTTSMPWTSRARSPAAAEQVKLDAVGRRRLLMRELGSRKKPRQRSVAKVCARVEKWARRSEGLPTGCGRTSKRATGKPADPTASAQLGYSGGRPTQPSDGERMAQIRFRAGAEAI